MGTLVAGSKVAASGKRARVSWAVWLLIIVLVLGAAAGIVIWGSIPSGNVLTDSLSVPLNGATAAKVEIRTDAGHLTIDKLSSGEQALAGGTLQYFENDGPPTRSVNTSNGLANFTLTGGGAGQSWIRMPWSACSGAYEWQVHLNPSVQSDVTAYSGGGNLKLNFAGMAVTRVMAETGGGNVDVALPDSASDLSVTARTGGGNVTVEMGSGITGSSTVNANSGAGNVVVRVPSGIAARIHATSGLGQVTVDPRFSKSDNDTYQSPDYDTAANRIEITVNNGAGDVSVNSR